MSAAWDERVDAIQRGSFGEAEDDVVEILSFESVDAPGKPLPGWIRAAMLGLVIVVALVAFLQADQLRQAWSEAKSRESESHHTQPVGYVNIYPMVSLAQRPRNWLRDEGDSTLLWSGWSDGRHHWFTVPRGQLSGLKLGYYQNGRDVIRPIDQPILEGPDGLKRKRVSPQAIIYPISHEGLHRAYPIEVLRRVEIANEELGGRPLLVNFSNFRALKDAVRVYDPVIGGDRLMMGATGYDYRDGLCSVLFDRQTESLWIDDEAGLKCVAGPRRGQILPVLFRAEPVAWLDWETQHPDGDLVVGAHRDPLPNADADLNSSPDEADKAKTPLAP